MKQAIEQAYMQGIAAKPAGSRQSMAILKKTSLPAFALGSAKLDFCSGLIRLSNESICVSECRVHYFNWTIV